MIPSVAFGKFVSSANGTPTSIAAAVNSGNTPSATATGTTVNLSWTASTLSTGDAVTGYVIKRYDTTGTVEQTIASGSCSSTVSGTTCDESSVPEGTWKYSVTPAHNNWRGAESSKASVTVDVTGPPTPTITASPPDPSTSGSATFTFTDAEPGVSFECRIDGGAYTACTSPKSYSNLTNGSHTFQVRALDAVGNASSAASYIWSVQTCQQVSVNSNFFSPASATITAGCSVTWTRVAGTHNSTSTTGVWSSPTLDTPGEAFTYQFNTAGTYPYRCTFHPGSMTGTITVNGLTGDTTPPTTAITFPASGSTFNNAGWTAGCAGGAGDFCGTASDGSGSGVNKVRVSIQQGTANYWSGSTFGSATEVLFDATGTTSWSYAFAATNFPTDGPYTIRAKAIDNENNVSTVASTTFTIDRTAPPTPTITANPPNPSTSTSASFGFTDAEPGVSFECRIDGGAYSACTSPKSYSSLATGSHTFEVRALDAVGNQSAAASYTWSFQACSQVSISNFAFTPASVSITAGCSVGWTQTSGTAHNTRSDTGVWSSPNLSNGQSFAFQFDTPGTYPYKCTIHPGSMTGTITVN